LGTRGLCVVSTYSAQIARIPTPDGMTAVNTGIRCHETLAVASPSSLMSACTHLRELAVSALMHWSSGYVLLRGRINWTINRPGLLSICKHGGSSTRASTPGLQRRRSERMSDQPLGYRCPAQVPHHKVVRWQAHCGSIYRPHKNDPLRSSKGPWGYVERASCGLSWRTTGSKQIHHHERAVSVGGGKHWIFALSSTDK
jgi:hypothetical protein